MAQHRPPLQQSGAAGTPNPTDHLEQTMTTHICDLTPSGEEPETARALLYRHGLPEDVIDGVLCLHAQELAGVQRKAHDEQRPYSHMGLPCRPEWLCATAALIDLIDPTKAAAASAVATPPTNRADLRERIAEALWRAGGPAAAEEANVDAVLAVLGEQADRAADAERPLSPDYQHPECGFHWHGRDGMDIPMRDGQPVCPRCELQRVEKRLQHFERRCVELREESLRRGKIKGEQAERIRILEREIDGVRRQLSAEILRANQAEADIVPDWEAMYEPGNVSDYLIGYANSEAAAKGAAEAWMRSQAEVTGRLEWVPDDRLATGRYDRWFELVERHDDGVDTGPGIVVRRRMAVEAHDTGTQQACACGHVEGEHRRQRPGWTREACTKCDCVDYHVEAQQQPDTEAPWKSDGARIGRALIWSWSDVGKGEFGRGYRAAQEEVRALLNGHRAPAPVAQQPAAVPCSWVAVKSSHSPHDWQPQPGMDPVPCPGYKLPPMDPIHILGIDADSEQQAAAADGEETP